MIVNFFELISIHRKWMLLFGFWLVFLSGALANFVGSPGVLQLMRLRNLQSLKEEQLSHLQDEVKTLQNQSLLLLNSHIAQEQEIRHVLGYAASDEIIFDFTPSNQF